MEICREPFSFRLPLERYTAASVQLKVRARVAAVPRSPHAGYISCTAPALPHRHDADAYPD